MRSIFMGVKRIQEKELDYYLLADELENTGENYGVQVCYANGETDCVRGITFSQSQIMRLLVTLMEQTVTPVTLRDVVEDWILQ